MTIKAAITGHEENKARQSAASRLSIIGAVFIMLMTGAAGLMVDSITMIIDASTSLIMVMTGLLMFFAINKIHRPPDDFFNFGYHKYEPFTVVAQGFLIIATCILGIKFAIQDIIHPDDIKNYYVPAAATAAAGFLGTAIFLYIKKEAAATGSSLLKMASVHWFTEAALEFGLFLGFMTGLVLTEMGQTRFTHYIDPVMTLLLAAYLIKEPMESVLQSSRDLLDAAPSKDIKEKIKKVVDKYSPGVLGSHRVRTRKAGDRYFVDVRFEVEPALTAIKMRELAENFEKEVTKHLTNCDVVVFFNVGQKNIAEPAL